MFDKLKVLLVDFRITVVVLIGIEIKNAIVGAL